jgi:predicted AAA+ superfamily ATPase
VVTVLGTRQSGKTTLVRSEFPDHEYLNLEDPDTRDAAERDYSGFFATHPGPLILDEIQRVPKLLSAIQVRVDEKREPGKYILTGSHQPLLRAGITQSLAGRTGIAQLWPLSVAELADAGINLDRDEYLFCGFLPGHYANAIPPSQLFANYYSTYVERDVRQLVNVEKLKAFAMFIKLLAGRVGQLVNLRSMSGEIGVTTPTLSAWLSVLEASFIIFPLTPYYSNFGKRLIKTPKLYFTEPGLATWLLGITSPEQVVRDPLAGGLFENMVVAEAFKARCNAGLTPELYFFRSHDGFEIDLLLNIARRLLPLEIKASRSFSPSLARTLRAFQEITESSFSPTVLYAGETETISMGITYSHFKNTAKIINNANPPPALSWSNPH